MSERKKISIGSNIIEGPWGGGNQFARSLSEYLENNGWHVSIDLKEPGIDIILMTEPRLTSATSRFNQLQIAKYVLIHPDTIVVHRINECDERKKTKNVNRYLARANKVADFTVFISKFLMELFINQGFFSNKQYKYIRNGADVNIFNRKGKVPWDGSSPLKLVTHHWAYNYYKGFDIYFKLGSMQSIGEHKMIFTYIGRLPSDVKMGNSKVLGPLSGVELAEELKKHHIYVTGSVSEPAGMHHIEAAMSGLPVLYRNSGALPEYCNGYGVMFEGLEDLEHKLVEIIDNYSNYYSALDRYPYSSDRMCKNYEKVFTELLEKKQKIKAFRRRLKYFYILMGEIFLQFFEIIFIKLKKVRRLKKILNVKK